MNQVDNSKKNKTKNENDICISVFKSGKNITTKQEYTKIWIQFINRMERSKSVNFC